jgi:hypothetical protein
MKNLISNIIFLFLIHSLSFSQERDMCEILKIVYEDHVKGKYQKIYIANRTSSSTVYLEEQFAQYFQSLIPERIFKKIIYDNNIESRYLLKNCFDDSLLGNKDSLIRHIKQQQPYLTEKDSSFVKYVDQKQTELLKIQDLEIRYRLLNELTETSEFKKYTALLDFKTPRIIEFSIPIEIEDFIFLSLNVIKNYSDDRFSMIYIYKKEKNVWNFLTKKYLSF